MTDDAARALDQFREIRQLDRSKALIRPRRETF